MGLYNPCGVRAGACFREVYSFRRQPYPLFTSEVAVDLLSAAERGGGVVETTIDLWRSREKVEVSGGGVMVRGEAVPVEDFRRVARDERSVYALVSGELRKVEVRAEHFYKLVKSGVGHAPTLEIDGIHMHRVKDVYPEEDAYLKVKNASSRLRNSVVLDTCTGLGYTAIWAAKLGASTIITVEKDVNVLKIAEINPWSWELDSGNITIVNDDTSRLIYSLPEEAFHVVIHDPPRFSLAGELYSGEFYAELFRILRPGGILIHYVGQPGARSRGLRLYRGVVERLRAAGFEARWSQEQRIVVAYKRRGAP
ncbi:Polyamine aminopropyltransferase [Candidatus Calditenuaceae archaeon HR02]|nr:Polyamine aminopropyltransferase [Candidatus Calditenuaceae archaeon HR02]